ncbi:MAG TPA: hypothetical protein VLJ59_02140 [Mycobacteriales bacterium]|nr:hypothetical protein [Mycobacteriales bacterium]
MTAGSHPKYQHRSVLVVDVESSSVRPDGHLMALRRSLYDIVDDALLRSSIPAARRVREDRGDGVLMLLDARVPKIDLVDPLLDRLADAVAAHNQHNPPLEWLRLRIALHSGEVERDQHGWGGEALTRTFRLVEAAAVKATLASAARAHCVIVVSDEFYQAVVRHRHRSIEPAHYRPIAVPVRGERVRAWVRVPGYPEPPIPADDAWPPAGPERLADAPPPTPPGPAERRVSIQAETIGTVFNDKVEVHHDLNIH